MSNCAVVSGRHFHLDAFCTKYLVFLQCEKGVFVLLRKKSPNDPRELMFSWHWLSMCPVSGTAPCDNSLHKHHDGL